MTYDLYLWKGNSSTTVSRGLAYLCLGGNVACEGLGTFPQAEVLARVINQFGDEPDFELDLSDTHAFFGIGHGEVTVFRPWLVSLASELSLEIYDPQEERPTEAELRAFDVWQSAQTGAGFAEDLQRWMGEAAAGDAVAMNELGNCYAGGEGVEVNWEEAVRWYGSAVAKGFLPAMLNLAECYRRGDGVQKNTAAAARLYAQAYEQDRCVAAYALGEMYRDGEGVEKSLDRAEEHFTIARAHRHPDAYLALKAMGRAPSD